MKDVKGGGYSVQCKVWFEYSTVQMFRSEIASGKKVFLCLLVWAFADLSLFPEGKKCPWWDGSEVISSGQHYTFKELYMKAANKT